tara:strand:+ start:24270 stop:25208 length:939 start_codon:yes stop_codon:yes gene_type:complete
MSNFFILSFSRSGSTLLGNILNNNKSIKLINESWIIPVVSTLNWKKLNYSKQKYILHLYNNSQKIYLDRKIINKKICVNRTISFEEFYNKILEEKEKKVGEKNPSNTLHYKFLKENIKNPKFIFLIRNPLSISNSYRTRWFKKRKENYFLYRVSVVIKTYFTCYKNLYKNKDVLTIRYEDLVKNPTIEIKKICSHINIDFYEEMMKNDEKIIFNKENQEHHKKIKEKINTKNLNNYKKELKESQINDLSYLLRKEISFLGYKEELSINPTKKLLTIEKRVSKRIKYNKSKTKKNILKFKYYMFYIKHIFYGQ